jgi:hypothetical protein
MSAAAARPRVLLQTTIPYTEDDWHVGRFSLLRDELAKVADVVARDRENGPDGNDPVLAGMAESDFDQIWLIAVDTGDGITTPECAAITQFRESGGHVFVTRDHMDLGVSVCNLGGIGDAHYFHSKNPDPNPENRANDDRVTTSIQWPNYYSGPNGDVQTIDVIEPAHPVFDGVHTLPSHPHEGAVGAPPSQPDARVVARSKSKQTGRTFNIAVAFDGRNGSGKGWAESTFHHFVDYNWDVAAGCPSFLAEPPSDAIAKNPHLIDETKRYVRNLVSWFGTSARKDSSTGKHTRI